MCYFTCICNVSLQSSAQYELSIDERRPPPLQFPRNLHFFTRERRMFHDAFHASSTHAPHVLHTRSARKRGGATLAIISLASHRPLRCVAWPSIRMLAVPPPAESPAWSNRATPRCLSKLAFLIVTVALACLQAVLFRNGRVDGDGVIAVIGNGEGPFAVRRGFGFRGCLAGQRHGDVGDRLLVGVLQDAVDAAVAGGRIAFNSTACAPESAADAMAGGSTKASRERRQSNRV